MQRLVVTVILFFFSFQLWGQQEQFKAYQEGERLLYVINYQLGFIRTDVGEAEAKIEIDNSEEYGEHYHAKVAGTTYKFYDIFFKVRDYFESRFRIDNGKPYYFHRDVLEGRYTMINHHYFQDDNSIKAYITRKSAPTRDTLLQGSDRTFDIVSLFYDARNIDFANVPIGINQPISFTIDDEVYDVYYRYLGKEEKRVPSVGSFKTMKFAAKLISGEVFSGKEEIVVWVSDDKNRIPLLFETPIMVGKVRGRLIEFENLKYPLSSFIQ